MNFASPSSIFATVDLLLTVALSVSLVGMGVAALWLLPWSDADRAGTARALASVVRRAGEAASRSAPFRALPAR